MSEWGKSRVWVWVRVLVEIKTSGSFWKCKGESESREVVRCEMVSKTPPQSFNEKETNINPPLPSSLHCQRYRETDSRSKPAQQLLIRRIPPRPRRPHQNLNRHKLVRMRAVLFMRQGGQVRPRWWHLGLASGLNGDGVVVEGGRGGGGLVVGVFGALGIGALAAAVASVATDSGASEPAFGDDDVAYATDVVDGV